MIVAGVDLGKNKAALSVFVEGQLTMVDSVELRPTLHRAANLHTLATWVELNTRACEGIYIEEALVGRSVRASLAVAETVGAVQSALVEKRVYSVPVTRWKKEVVGKGNATKEEVAFYLKSTYPLYSSLCENNQDRVDAICIGLYGVDVERVTRQLLEDI